MATTDPSSEKATAVKQILTGLQTAETLDDLACTGCDRPLRDGTRVVARTSKPADADRWQICRVYCRDCHDTDAIRTPTLGATDALAAATLAITQSAAQQATYPVLADVTVLDHSPTTDGGVA